MKIILSALLLLSISTLSYAGVSQTQSYRVSLTIPAVVGLNVGVEPSANLGTSKDLKNQEIIKERIVRNNTPIILETIVLK